jgi:TM2 domain-containing membrane protein YozV
MDETNGENPERPQAPTQPVLPPPPPYYPPPPPPPATKGLRVPFVALALSFIFPGAGQMYNGHLAKALFVFFGFVGAIYATAEAGFPFAFGIPFVYFFNIIDAYRSAVLLNEQAAGGQRVEESTDPESPLWGASLALLGVLILLNNFGLVRLASIGRLWPLALVVAGVVFIYQATGRKKDRPSGGSDAFLS